jgi:hypothetical protein
MDKEKGQIKVGGYFGGLMVTRKSWVILALKIIVVWADKIDNLLA